VLISGMCGTKLAMRAPLSRKHAETARRAFTAKSPNGPLSSARIIRLSHRSAGQRGVAPSERQRLAPPPIRAPGRRASPRSCFFCGGDAEAAEKIVVEEPPDQAGEVEVWISPGSLFDGRAEGHSREERAPESEDRRFEGAEEHTLARRA